METVPCCCSREAFLSYEPRLTWGVTLAVWMGSWALSQLLPETNWYMIPLVLPVAFIACPPMSTALSYLLIVWGSGLLWLLVGYFTWWWNFWFFEYKIANKSAWDVFPITPLIFVYEFMLPTYCLCLFFLYSYRFLACLTQRCRDSAIANTTANVVLDYGTVQIQM